MFQAFDYSNGSRGTYLGKIVLKTQFKASEWGDSGLFFKHQRIEDEAQD
jgi:hypothetical protein